MDGDPNAMPMSQSTPDCKEEICELRVYWAGLHLDWGLQLGAEHHAVRQSMCKYVAPAQVIFCRSCLSATKSAMLQERIVMGGRVDLCSCWPT